MEHIENEFNKIQPLFNKGKKYLIGKNKDIKISIENYENYFNQINACYESLKKNSR